MINQEVGLRLRMLRKAYNLSIDELAKTLNITSGFLGLIERGYRGLTLPRLLTLSKLFNVSIDYLITGVGDEPKKMRENPVDFLGNILNEYELLKLAELGKIISMYKYDKSEADILFNALQSQLKFFIAMKNLNQE